MQRMVGFGEPCAGVVFGNGVHQSPVTIDSNEYVRLGAESEVAVVLKRDLPASSEPYDRASVADAVEALMPAFELMGDRGADYSNLLFLSVVADNTWNAGVVLGPQVTTWQDVDLAAAGGDCHQRAADRRRERQRRVGASPYGAVMAGQHVGLPGQKPISGYARDDRQHRQHQIPQCR